MWSVIQPTVLSVRTNQYATSVNLALFLDRLLIASLALFIAVLVNHLKIPQKLFNATSATPVMGLMMLVIVFTSVVKRVTSMI